MTYQVQAGDTLFGIARKHNITPHKLLELNNLPSTTRLSIGQSLIVSEEFTSDAGSTTHYIVQAGDTLFGIARKYNLTPAKILEINSLPSGSTLSVGQRIIVSEEGIEALKKPYQDRAQTAADAEGKYHVVASGESLWTIAKKYDATPAQIRDWNQLSSYQLSVGQKIKVGEGSTSLKTPSTPSPAVNLDADFHTVQSGESLWTIAKSYNLTTSRIRELNNLSPQATISLGQKLWLKPQHPAEDINRQQKTTSQSSPYHTVERGDTLFSISRANGLTPNELLEINGLPSNTSLYLGQQLRVKKMKVESATSETTHYTVERGDSLFSIAKRFSLSVQQLRQMNNLGPQDGLSLGQQLLVVPQDDSQKGFTQVQKVRDGESLKAIAERNRTTEQEIMKANNMKSDQVRGGQTLVVPKASKPPVPTRYRDVAAAIEQARKQFTLIEKSGSLYLSHDISGPVGEVSSMAAADVENVQKALMEHDILQSSHGETPRGGTVNSAQIPKTINAIKKFQTVYKTSFFQTPTTRWKQVFGDKPMFENTSFTPGTIKPGDLTLQMLRDFTDYTLIVPNPKGGKITANFRNFVASNFSIEPLGVSFVGSVTAETIPLDLFKSLGLNDSMAEALKIVSSHEGNLDALNTYDKAWLSYGFIQFAGSAVNGPLGAIVGTMKLREPALFDQYFGQFGIDVVYEMKGDKVFKGELTLFDLNNTDGVWEKRGVEADKAIGRDKLLYGCFIRAAYEPKLAACQVVGAVDGFVKPALNNKISLDIPGAKVNHEPITDYINSPLGVAVMVDVTVNQWITKTAAYFKTAIEAVASQTGVSSVPQLKNINEQKVIEYLAAYAPDDRTKKRAASMLKSGLSSAKSPHTAVVA